MSRPASPLDREDYLDWADVLALLAATASGHRSGRITAELTVTKAVYGLFPGIGEVWQSASGETVWRKKILVLGSPTAKVALVCILPPGDGLLLG